MLYLRTFIALLAFVAFTAPLPAAAPEPGVDEARAAVGKALPLMQKGAAGHIAQKACFACHNQGIPILAMTTARSRGFEISGEDLRKQMEFTAAFLGRNRENYLKGRGQGGQVDTAGYALWTLELGGWKPDATTAAVAEYLLLYNENLDHWRVTANRPPSEVSQFTANYLAIRALKTYGTAEQKQRIAKRIDTVRAWLQKTAAKDTEDRVFRLWALKVAEAPEANVQAAAKELTQTQRKDGGWGQLDTMDSDSYATGSALVALHQAGGLATNDPAYRRGLKFLLQTQLPDGSWLVRSRSKPFQTYYESGFPHGKDQFISMAASGWATTALALAAPEVDKEPLTIDDLYRFDHPQDAALSPDGQRLVYVRRWIDRDTKRERQALWVVDGQPARPLEPGQPDGRSPVFSPDGKWIAFLSTRPDGWKLTRPVPPESDPATDIWLISSTGRPAIPLQAGFGRLYGRVFNDGFYGRIAFSPDGRRLAFITDDGTDPRTKEEIEADVVVVRPDQGEGYTGYGPAQVWVADLEVGPTKLTARRVERLTDDDVWYGDPQWSPDGRSLVVHANKTDDRESVRYSINKNFDLWRIDVQTQKVQQLTTGPGPEVSPRFSPDGKRLVCLSIPRKGTHRDAFNLALVTLGEGGARTEVLFDHHRPDAEKPPHPIPMFPLPLDCWDGNDHLVYHTAVGTETRTVRLDLRTGKSETLATLTQDEKPDLKTLAGRAALRRRLTPPGDQFLLERELGETRLVHWKNSEGHRIEGLLTLPPAGVAQPPYKLLLHPHGGPHGRSTRGFNFAVQVFAAHGYAVFQPNFRGSEGYGQKFIDADRSDFGGGDMRDILTGIDHLVSQKLVDRDRQFVYGSSYGGFMTCWLVGHTTQFRAAVAQNAVTDLNVMWGLSDLRSWTEWEFGGRPWEVPGALRKHSPLTHVANVKTPTLVLHAREDRRCPIAMGRMFYEALRAQKVPTQMVIYPGEGHGIRQPRHQEDVLRRILAWFQKHDTK